MPVNFSSFHFPAMFLLAVLFSIHPDVQKQVVAQERIVAIYKLERAIEVWQLPEEEVLFGDKLEFVGEFKLQSRASLLEDFPEGIYRVLEILPDTVRVDFPNDLDREAGIGKNSDGKILHRGNVSNFDDFAFLLRTGTTILSFPMSDLNTLQQQIRIAATGGNEQRLMHLLYLKQLFEYWLTFF